MRNEIIIIYKKSINKNNEFKGLFIKLNKFQFFKGVLYLLFNIFINLFNLFIFKVKGLNNKKNIKNNLWLKYYSNINTSYSLNYILVF